jgi:trimeric autotransporter adhesin
MANPGGGVSLTMSLASAGQSLSGVQFDIVWDPSLNVNVVTGAQIGLATKVLYASLLQPRVLRCMIVGMNKGALADGELIRLFISVNSTAAAGTSQFSLLNLSATGGDGTPVFLTAGSTAVQIQGGSVTQTLQPGGVLNAGSLAAGPISPGEIITLMGSIPAVPPTILVNGVPATVTYAGPNQVNAIAPFELDSNNPAVVQINQGASSVQASVATAAASPSIFTLSTTGAGPGAILNQNYSVNSPTNPAARGSALMIYGTGFGVLNPTPVDGQTEKVLAQTPLPVTATIDGVPAQVLYAGAAPGLLAGVVQINVQVPGGVKPNLAAPISLRIGSFTTQPGVTVSIN